MSISKITYCHYLLISSPKIHTDILWDLTVLFLILGGLYFLFIFFFRNRFSSIARKRKSKRAELAPVISNFLFYTPQDPKEEQKEYVRLKIEIREYLGDKNFRKILANILFDLQRDISGDARNRLFKLFIELGLHHDSFKKLSSWRWNTVSQGILELSQMEVADSFQLISKFINDRRGVVRKQAEIAIVSLNDHGIEHLLDTTKYAISEWQQLKLIEAIGTINDYQPPKFKSWLVSHNKDVVLFSLRLIRHFNQNDAAASIAELVKHKNDEVKIAAIDCIQEFNFFDSVDILKKVFWKCNTKVKIQILDTVGKIGNQGDLMFLHEVSSVEHNFAVVSKANGAINTIAPDTVLPTRDIIEDLNTPIVRDKSGLEDADFLQIDVDCDEVTYTQKAIGIEVDEVEVYDLVADGQSPETTQLLSDKISGDGAETVSNIETEESPLLTELEYELDQSLNQSLGLIDVNLDQTGTKDNLDELQEGYQRMSSEERSLFLDSFEKPGHQEAISVLEFIVENEEESELRFRAFNKLKHLDNEIGMEEEIEELPAVSKPEDKLPEYSVFYELYRYASDMDSKAILINEMMDIGDEKEIPLLRNLVQTEQGKIKQLAGKALAYLTKKYPEKVLGSEVHETTDPAHSETLDQTNSSDTDQLAEIPVQNEPSNTTDDDIEDERIPLELCFLYDELGISYDKEDKKEDLGLNFELSAEFFAMIATENQNLEDQ
ncbi:hypothetical protein MTsPCn5_06350 [Croceitalea sp. MTPC5]|uniref:hypothetical protein n=1 Tax=Croceitalea sp. MTPC5 TaxID=3056565 RepID=UPI002B3871CD|nr:hypothetical protein MTsPCn5_06350 [Croceitalea sp. MTPC5]